MVSSYDNYKETEDLLARAQAGDNTARAKVYEANIGLVYMVMERFKNTCYDYEDLFQVGSVGLLKAIDKFDFQFQVRFSTYAVPMIIGEIKKFLRDDGIVKVQRSIKENYGRIRWAQDKLRSELGREPSVAEIASTLDMVKEDVVTTIEACQAPAYIHDALPRDDRGSPSLMDRLGDEEGNIRLLEQLALREALSKLSDREREVILRRYFKDETQSAIANDLGVSQVQVSRIEKMAINKLKEMLD